MKTMAGSEMTKSATCRSADKESTICVAALADLVGIYQAGINVCIMPRAADAAAAHYCDAVLRLGDWEKVLQVPVGCTNLRGLLPDGGEDAGAAAFLADVGFLLEVYAELLGAEALGVRLTSSHGAMCPRFHVDRVGVRLVCTYSGPGTQWLDSAIVDRSKLGHRAGSLGDEESGLLVTPEPIPHMQRYAMGLLKGESWPGNQGNGAVHRSPAVPAWGPRRVLLTVEGL